MTAMKRLLAVLFVVYFVGCGKASDNLEACRACGEMVSKKAKQCPECGEPNPTESIEEEFRKETDDIIKKAFEDAGIEK